jgi:hypothetical protein
MCENWGYKKLANYIKKQSIDEMNPAEALIEGVLFLAGTLLEPLKLTVGGRVRHMLAVAEHCYHFEGKNPINQQTRELISALEAELQRNGPNLPIYWGNRNWHPFWPTPWGK